MKVIVLGAGILGVATAWYLLEDGHEVTVLDRQADAALETSFANGGQISVGYCEPWAGPGTPAKVARWLLRDDAPLLFRPRLDAAQWRWGLAFLAACRPAAFERNVAQLLALGRYSQASLQALVAQTGISYDRLRHGILHFFSSAAAFDAAAAGAERLRRLGLERQLLTPAQAVQVEPALAAYGDRLAGATYVASDETGDARAFTQQLAARCAERGAHFLYGHTVLGLEGQGGRVSGVRVAAPPRGVRTLPAGQVVVALGAHSVALLRPLGERLNLYPAKGYSATLALKVPARANRVSLIDDQHKIGFTRLGDRLRIAGTAQLSGYDTDLAGRIARRRCQALLARCEAVLPGVADTSEPHFWAGLRPSTPDNRPLIGRSARWPNLWLNTGHGTLGWTLGAGSGRALAELMAGRRPDVAFDFRGVS